MINNCDTLRNFYRKLMENEKIPYLKALAIYEDLHNEAVKLGVITHENILEGIEIDIKIAKAVNGLPE
ncbi:MAG: hypothetical protein BWY69_01468 [Planctomycetes bacterium ADurb.Bin401]|nr:MAG: hypothetical protein BWY69_01468 [Planctomycetes bacterium ADurb.Bin401]